MRLGNDELFAALRMDVAKAQDENVTIISTNRCVAMPSPPPSSKTSAWIYKTRPSRARTRCCATTDPCRAPGPTPAPIRRAAVAAAAAVSDSRRRKSSIRRWRTVWRRLAARLPADLLTCHRRLRRQRLRRQLLRRQRVCRLRHQHLRRQCVHRLRRLHLRRQRRHWRHNSSRPRRPPRRLRRPLHLPRSLRRLIHLRPRWPLRRLRRRSLLLRHCRHRSSPLHRPLRRLRCSRRGAHTSHRSKRAPSMSAPTFRGGLRRSSARSPRHSTAGASSPATSRACGAMRRTTRS